MELHERLSGTNGHTPAWTGTADPFAEVKNRIHLAIVSELGPRLFEVADGDSARDRVVGEIRTQLQQEVGLSNGGALKLTVGEYFTPDGTNLAGRGIRPDVVARDAPRTPRDEALDRALAVLAAQ